MGKQSRVCAGTAALARLVFLFFLFLLERVLVGDQVLARCVQWQSTFSRLVYFGQACTTSSQFALQATWHDI